MNKRIVYSEKPAVQVQGLDFFHGQYAGHAQVKERHLLVVDFGAREGGYGLVSCYAPVSGEGNVGALVEFRCEFAVEGIPVEAFWVCAC